MKVIIIEDEHLMADELEMEIRKCDPGVEIIAKLTCIQEAIQYFTKNELPDLFFSDIQLPDGLSFEIFKSINSTIPVIFCTAYDEYALEAFKANGIDYILKPFDSQVINKTLSKYKNLSSNQNHISDTINNLLNNYKTKTNESGTSVLVHKGDKIFPVKPSDIAMIYLENGITYIYTFKNDYFPAEISMEKLEKKLGRNFFRANRQFIVNHDAVKHASKYFARKLLVNLKIDAPKQLIVSKANASRFLSWLESVQ